ncbi:MAG: GAF domain-containing protein [Bacteroidetes bacterium]|nr:GAF domain-containing protein [Bacteroidota bacterium]
MIFNLLKNKKALSIKQKMLLFFLTPITIILGIAYLYILFNFESATQNQIILVTTGFFIIIILLILFLILIISKSISNPLVQIHQKLNMIAQGKIEQDYTESTDSCSEIKAIEISYNTILTAWKNAAHFTGSIKNGNLESEFKLLSEKDQLGKSLIDLRDQIKESSNQQKQQQEEERKRYWTSDGLAKLNEILRKQDNIDDYSFSILSFLVNYLEANQGGIFIRNVEDENNKLLELKAFYAFNRRKFIQKTFEYGEGLVGNCALEKQTTYLTEIPNNYIEITSGLGGSNPKSLLLVPLKIEEEVLGIIEIASFNTFEPYQIEFLEQACLSIASSINMAETNKRTSELLEKTQQQAEEMSAQEEEMRQNMEELQATQEESDRRAKEFEQKSDEIEKINVIMEKQLEKALRKIDKLSEKKR